MDWRNSLLKISVFLKINNPGVDSSSTDQSSQVPGQPSLCPAGMSPALFSYSSRHVSCSKFPSYWGWIKWKQNYSQSLRRDVLTQSKNGICAHFSQQLFIQQPGHWWCGPNMPNKHCRWWFCSAKESFLLLQENHRIVKVGKRPPRSSSPTINPSLPGPTLNNAPRCYMYAFSEHFQKWWFHHLPGQCFPLLDHPFNEEIFPWQNLKPKISPCSV